MLFVLLVTFLMGESRMLLALEMNPPVPERFSIQFKGEVVSEPCLNQEGSRILCELHLRELDGTPIDCRVRLYLRSEIMALEGIEYGQTLTCFGHVWPQDHASNPFQYDQQNGLLSDGLAGMAAAKLEDVDISAAKPSLGRWRAGIRRAISDRIALLFPRNTELVRAFVLGDRTGLEWELRDTFNETGVAHLICISGLHISMLAMALSRLLSMVLPRRTASILTLTAVVLYGFLIGFPPSLTRATVMFAVFSLGALTGRPSDPITRLAAALSLMLILNPFNVYDGGFALSFSASAGMLMLNEPIAHLLRADLLNGIKPSPNRIRRMRQRAVQYFPRLLCGTLSAQIATLPAVIACFGAQSVIAIPVNLLAIPLAMLAYPLALAAIMVSAVFLLPGVWLAWLADGLFALLVRMIGAFAALPVSMLRAPQYPLWLTAAHCGLMLAASGLTRIPIKKRQWMPLGLTALLGVSMISAWFASLPFRAVFLDAGQADAAVVRAEGKVLLFDTGDLYSPVTDYVTGCCLGVDAAFLSHPHYDHAAGMARLLEEMPPKVIYVPRGWFDVEATDSVQAVVDRALEMNIPFVELAAGDTVSLTDDLCVRVFGPDGDEDSVNDLSLVLELVYREHSVLFTGDLSMKGEPDSLPDVDALKVPHHGSPKATSQRLLDETTPAFSIVSVGENNYGHPGAEVLERLEASGSAVYRTDESGAVTLWISPGGRMRVETFLPSEASK